MKKDIVLLTLSDWNQKILSKHIVDSTVVSLEPVVELNEDGEFSFDLRKWEEIMKKYVPVPAETPCFDFGFFDKKDHFEIIFNGAKKTFKPSLGLKYILAIIKTPCKGVFAADLKFVADGVNPEKMGSILGEGPSGDEIALAEVVQKYRECKKQEMAVAEMDGNELLMTELTNEMEGYIKYIRSIKGFNQSGIKENNYRLDKIRISVYQAVRRALANIGEQLPECARHLEASIETGNFITYTIPNIKWVF